MLKGKIVFISLNFVSSSTFGKNANFTLECLFEKNKKPQKEEEKLEQKFLMENKCNFNNFSEAHKLGNTVQHHVISHDHS